MLGDGGGRAVKDNKTSSLLTLGLSVDSSAEIRMGPIIFAASGLLELPQGRLKKYGNQVHYLLCLVS